MKITFGKHKDKPLSEVPADYLEYICRQDWFKNVKLGLRRAICEKLNIPLIERDNPYKRNLGGVTKNRAIMDKNLKKSIEKDDFNDLHK